MNIALLGYGKMGRAIEAMAIAQGHAVTLRIGRANRAELTPAALHTTDVAVEFSAPEQAFDNLAVALAAGVPVVCGSTGWLHRLPEARALAHQHHTALLYAANFSIGVNLFFALNTYLGQLMAPHPGYRAALHEIHHTQKLDAPSGTAIHLAEALLEVWPHQRQWVSGPAQAPDELGITSARTGNTPGVHEVVFQSEVDTLLIRHEAHSREGFAQGALLAAHWLRGRTGFFTMQDVLAIPKPI